MSGGPDRIAVAKAIFALSDSLLHCPLPRGTCLGTMGGIGNHDYHPPLFRTKYYAHY